MHLNSKGVTNQKEEAKPKMPPDSQKPRPPALGMLLILLVSLASAASAAGTDTVTVPPLPETQIKCGCIACGCVLPPPPPPPPPPSPPPPKWPEPYCPPPPPQPPAPSCWYIMCQQGSVYQFNSEFSGARSGHVGGIKVIFACTLFVFLKLGWWIWWYIS